MCYEMTDVALLRNIIMLQQLYISRITLDVQIKQRG